jgi:hypothetical protein
MQDTLDASDRGLERRSIERCVIGMDDDGQRFTRQATEVLLDELPS